MRKSPIFCCALVMVWCSGTVGLAQGPSPRDREIAAAYAPIFYQGLDDKPRSDYITNFNFDGDWRGDNNWEHADDKKFALQAYIYYAVAETATHFFIHYAVFHPRDYKGGELRGAILSGLMREGARRGGKYDPTGLAEETSLAHENDMEGCLVVVAKNGANDSAGRVEFVETLAHNKFFKYVVGPESPKGFETVRLEGRQVLLYIEPKGHGIEAFADQKIDAKKFLTYKFTGRAEDPTQQQGEVVGYDLVTLDVLWNKAKPANANLQGNETYGAFHKFGIWKISLAQAKNRVISRQFNLGSRGTAFLGKFGGINMARPPWAWFDRSNREQLGQWFFDPATVVKRDFKLTNTFPTAYVRAPFWAQAR
jgi:hypothetical protein